MLASASVRGRRARHTWVSMRGRQEPRARLLGLPPGHTHGPVRMGPMVGAGVGCHGHIFPKCVYLWLYAPIIPSLSHL